MKTLQYGCFRGPRYGGDRAAQRLARMDKVLTLEQFLSIMEQSNWQDMALSAGNVFFCITLIPMLRHPERPPLLTSIPTALALLAGGAIFATLHLWVTALTQTVAGLQWLAMAFKKSSRAPGETAPKHAR